MLTLHREQDDPAVPYCVGTGGWDTAQPASPTKKDCPNRKMPLSVTLGGIFFAALLQRQRCYFNAYSQRRAIIASATALAIRVWP